MKKRKLFTAPPLAMERLRDTEVDLAIRLFVVLAIFALAGIGLFTVVMWCLDA